MRIAWVFRHPAGEPILAEALHEDVVVAVGCLAHGAAAASLLPQELGHCVTWLLTGAGRGAGACGGEPRSFKMWFLTYDWRPWVVLASFKKSDKQLPALFQAEHNFPLCPDSSVPTPPPSPPSC